jgi:hypothetical protein
MIHAFKFNCSLFFILTFCFSTLQGQVEIHVSPAGNDKNPGSFEEPLRTISKSQELVREKIKETENDIRVYIHEGDYNQDKPLIFTSIDQGKGDQKVIYSAYKEDKPVIHGGAVLNNWEKLDDSTWATNYNGTYFRQLYVNGQRRVRAREPNTGSFYRVANYDFKHQEILVARNDISKLLNSNVNEVEMILQMHWAESILRLNSVSIHGPYNVSNANIRIHEDDAAIIFKRPHPSHRSGQAYHLENTILFLDEPGEWYYNQEEGKIYYKPLENETLLNTVFVVPKIQNLLIVRGEKDNPVKNLVFDGLTFMYSNWVRPGNDTYSNIQAGMFILHTDSANNKTVIRPPAAVHVTWANNTEFKNCVYKNLGSTGLDLNYGTNGCKVVGNVFKDIAGGGIMVGKFVEDSLTLINNPYNPDEKEIVSTGDLINNNYITAIGQDYFGTCAIAAGFTDNVQIIHNYIYNVPYTGISVGYGWTNEDNAMKNNVIAYNEIERAMTILADGAAIYTLSKQPGTLIKGNYIHDLKKSPWSSPWPLGGIYLDMESGGTLEKPLVLEKNLVHIDFDTGKPLTLNKERIILLVDNYWRKSGTPECEMIMNEAGLEKHYHHLINK